MQRVLEHKPHPIMQYFAYKHLPPQLASTSLMFHSLACWVDENLPNGPEKSVALRKILEAKDAAVRCALDLEDPSGEKVLHRDAGSGEFVTEQFAAENPGTTVTET